MSVAVCLAAMMPASRAVCNGSPLAMSPRRMRRRASADIVISPAALASRRVAGLSPTSTIRALPFASRWDSAFGTRALATRALSLSEVEREALERDGEVHALELYVGGDGQRAR